MTYLSREWREKLIAAGFPESELILGCSDEILRRLPDSIRGEKTTVPLIISYRAWSSKGFNIRYAHGLTIGDEQACVVSGDTLANAAAAMYVFLAENKLLPSPESE